MVLLLPPLGLSSLELGSGKTAFLAVLDAKIFFLGLILPGTVFIEWPHRQQDVGVGIVTIGIMDGNVGAHPLRYELLVDEIL